MIQKNNIKMRKVILLLIILLGSSITIMAIENPGHSAAQVGGGEFDGAYGSFVFPDTIYLGIGTIDPKYKLDVAGEILVNNSGVSAISSGNGITAFGSSGGAYGYGNTYGAYGQYQTSADNYGYLGGSDYGLYAQKGSTSWGFLGSSKYGAYGNNSNAGIVGNSSGSGTVVAGSGVFGSGSSYGAYGSSSTGSTYGFLGSTGAGAAGYYGSIGGYLGGLIYGAYGQYNSNIKGYLGASTRGVYGQYDSDTYGYIGSSTYPAYGQYDSDTYGYLISGTYGAVGYYTSNIYGWLGGTYGIYGRQNANQYGYLGGSSYGAYASYDAGHYAYLNTDGVTAVASSANTGSTNMGAYGLAESETYNMGILGVGKSSYTQIGLLGTIDASPNIPSYISAGVYGSYDEDTFGCMGCTNTSLGSHGIYGQYDSATYGFIGSDEYGVYGHAESTADYGVTGSNGGYAALYSYGSVEVEEGSLCVDDGTACDYNDAIDGSVVFLDGELIVSDGTTLSASGLDGSLTVARGIFVGDASNSDNDYIRFDNNHILHYLGWDDDPGQLYIRSDTMVKGIIDSSDKIQIGHYSASASAFFGSDSDTRINYDEYNDNYRFYADDAGYADIYVAGCTGCDIAEHASVSNQEPIEAGDILVVSDAGEHDLARSDRPYDPKVAGVFSSEPGIYMGDETESKMGGLVVGGYGHNFTALKGTDHNGTIPLALKGKVPVKVCLENGMISKGDFVTTSSFKGHGMRWTSIDPADAGSFEELRNITSINANRKLSVIGKALEDFDGTGSTYTNDDGDPCGSVIIYVARI